MPFNNELQYLNLHLELRLIHQEIRSLKEENQNQNIKISHLEEVIAESRDKKIVSEEISAAGDSSHGGDSSRQKRPYRLLPLKSSEMNKLVDSKKNILVSNPRRFYGPPTNCSDLSELGYTLNGFYLVKLGNNAEKSIQIETIYCAFQQPGRIFSSLNVEKRVSSWNFLGNSATQGSRGVHFHVSNQKSSDRGFRNKDVLKFDFISLNLGGSFDASSGVFTAPKSGVYQFIFKGSIRVIKGKQMYGFLIELLRNETVIVNSSIVPEDQVTMIEATWKLSRGDRIFLKIHVGEKGFLMNGNSCSTTFSGSLLEELL